MNRKCYAYLMVHCLCSDNQLKSNLQQNRNTSKTDVQDTVMFFITTQKMTQRTRLSKCSWRNSGEIPSGQGNNFGIRTEPLEVFVIVTCPGFSVNLRSIFDPGQYLEPPPPPHYLKDIHKPDLCKSIQPH